MTTINANFMRLATMVTSTEATRYYLNGVHVSAHACVGAILVATDGHRLICIHDESAVYDGPEDGVIVRLEKAMLAACKPNKRDYQPRLLQFGDFDKPIELSECDGESRKTTALQHDWRIDGCFPDWRRILPKEQEGKRFAFNASYMADFGTIAAALSGKRDGLISVDECDGLSPMLIRFLHSPHAFGVLMPVRSDSEHGLPDWVNARPDPEQDSAIAA